MVKEGKDKQFKTEVKEKDIKEEKEVEEKDKPEPPKVIIRKRNTLSDP